jgi:CPA2 family monovalent cation:H+ antiporter-2
MMMIPVLGGTERDILKIIGITGESMIIILLVILSARWLVPLLLHQIVRTRMRELFIISIIFICLGAAYLTHRLGLSLAIGAFIAGLIISESEYSYQAISDVLPFKDSFNGLFFISVGMLMNIDFLLENLGMVFMSVVGVVLLKTIISTGVIFSLWSNLRVSLQSGLILSQIGEFSFILSVAAMKQGLMQEEMYQLFLSSAIVTMLLTPLLVAISPRVSMWVTSRKLLMRLESMRALRDKSRVQSHREDHVIIIGFGMNGRNLALVLRELEVPYVALDLNSRTVTEWREKGEPILYGDATSQEILIKLGIERARVIVIAINDAAASRKIVSIARILNPRIFIIVRTAYLAEVDDLIKIGADEVIPAEFETSIELFSRVLKFYHMPKSLIRDYAERFRRDHYKMFFKGETPKRLFHETIAVMPDVEYESFVVKRGSRAAGSTYKELRIQEQTGAMIIGVKRGGDILRGLPDEFRFMEGDIVFLIGDKEALKKAGELYFD